MIITIYKFKNLTTEQQANLFQTIKQMELPHDLEIIDYDNNEKWDEFTNALYKAKKKAESKFKERIFKLKNNIL